MKSKSKYKVGDYFYHKYWNGFWVVDTITSITNGKDYTYPYYYYKVLKSSKINRYDDVDHNPYFQFHSPLYDLSKKLSDIKDETILAVLL